MADNASVESRVSVKRRTGRQNWQLFKAVWRAMQAFIKSPTPVSLIKRAYHHWKINEETTKLTQTLSIQGFFTSYETRLLGSVLTQNKLQVLRVGGLPFSDVMLNILFSALPSVLPTLKKMYLPDIGLGRKGGKLLWQALTFQQQERKKTFFNIMRRKSSSQTLVPSPYVLELLDVRNNGMTGEGLEGLDDALLSLPCLASMDLSSNMLNDYGILKFTKLVSNVTIIKEEEEVEETNSVNNGSVSESNTEVSVKNQNDGEIVPLDNIDQDSSNSSTIQTSSQTRGKNDISSSLINKAKGFLKKSEEGTVQPTYHFLPLEDLRMSCNGFSTTGLSELLSLFTQSSVFPKLHRCDISSNKFPAKPAGYAVRQMLESRRKDRLKRDARLAAELPCVVEAGQIDDDGTPKRFIQGLKLRVTNPKQSVRLRENELTMVLQGGFEISESEAVGLVPLKVNNVLASEVSQPRSLYYRNRHSLPSPRKPNHAPDLYPLIANHRRNPMESLENGERGTGEKGGLILAKTLAAQRAKQLKEEEEIKRIEALEVAKIEEMEKAKAPAPMLTFMRSDARTIRTELDRVPTIEASAGRPHGIEKPMPQLLAPPPSLLGSASRPLGGHRPRKFHPLTLHDEKAVLRSEYTNLSKALVLPDFVHDFRSRTMVPHGL